MKKGIVIFTLLILALFSVSCIYAADVNETLAASEDTVEIELSHEIESADDNLETNEEQTVTQTDNEEKTGATDDGTFEALRTKIDRASSGDTIYLENNYSAEDSWTQDSGISIIKSNLVIDGQGHTIDAKQKTRIFDVYYAENVTIKNIKFINAKYEGSGGAIQCYYSDGCVVSGCSFVNCSVEYGGGGAIQWYESANGSVSGCSFVNCAAELGGGGAIHWQIGSANGNISDCVFINNTDSNGKAINIAGSASLDRNWFGNTAENYETSPNAYIYGAVPDNWLFLNATAAPNPISIAETADIIFKLYLYNGSITDYTSLAKVDLTMNSNGKLDKNVIGLDEKVTFTPASPGTGSVTATIEDVAYTTTLTVTDGTTFWDLNKTINGNTNDTITLDNDYAYNQTTDSAFTNGIMITRPVTINGNGHTIDAKGKKSVFNVKANDVTIKNLTIKNAYIKNGYGGAIYLGMVDGCIVSQCNFINNTAKYGGAICGEGPENSVISQCIFINNSAECGGAIYWDSQSGNASNCVFLNNDANDGSAIYIVPYSYLTADYCWFGNTATDYDGDLPISGSCTNWMFLNVTANPDAIAVSETSDIIFKLFLYNSTSGNITEYDNAPFENLNLTIASTNGNVSKNTAKLGEIIKYNATNIGTGSVTASIENVAYTIELNIKYRPDLSVQSQEADYSSNTVITLVYNSTATGTVNITLKGKNRNYTFEKELNATISLGDIDADEYEVNVTYSGDNVFWNATATGKLTINKANSTLTINDNVTFDYNTNGSTTVSFTDALGVVAEVVGQPNAIVVVNDTTIAVSGLNAGTYTLTVTTITDANHNNVTKNATITVNKAKTQLTANAITATYNINKDLVITLKDANGNALSGVNVIVDLNGAKTLTTDKNGQVKVSTKGLAPKAYTAKITFNGNTNYAKSTKDVKVTVKKATPKLTAKKKTFKTTTKTKKYTIVLKDNTGKAIKKAKVTLKVKGKTYKATTNSKGKAVFKIKNLKKKGTFKATITYKGNKYYNKITKKANIKVIVTFKTVSKGSKDKSTVKEIQQALKDHGYYLSYKGHYLKVDGKFQSCTERSVKEFQHDKGLKVTGKVDEKTAKKLGII
ncbi:MAG: peptidoglycan-binding protein [Methanobrevibacter sp.]|nr:peptidoglycan-binding protein [Methanobrevibacter sp.]